MLTQECMAFEETVEGNLSTLANKVVTWHVDNQNVKQAWLNLGTIRDHWLCDELWLQKLLHEQNTIIFPIYVRSAQYLHAFMQEQIQTSVRVFSYCNKLHTRAILTRKIYLLVVSLKFGLNIILIHP